MSTHQAATQGETSIIRCQSWDKAIHAFATSYIFQRRARVRKRQLQILTYVGLVVPFTVGGLVLAYGAFNGLALIVTAASAVGVAQAAIALWSIIGGWVEGYSYATTSAAANESLSARFSELGRNPPNNTNELRHKYEKLQIEDNARREQDHRQGIKQAELRVGMRAALRQFQRPCAGCDEVPTSMKPTNCGVCGNFKYSNA
jgi:mobilome CxxCx(11)CxxC protein